MNSESNTFSIAHISDMHCGSPYFVPELLESAIEEINDHDPDVVVVSGDLTNEGFLPEYELALDYLDRLQTQNLVVIPGNHDARNVGYEHFEDLFGSRSSDLYTDDLAIVAVDSSEPDLDYGTVGRGRYQWIEGCFDREVALKVFVLHHHLLPVPGTGRERNVVHDAGDTLECLMRSGVNLVLSGHKHVPYAWRFESMFIVSTGTVSTLRVRGRTKPCYLMIRGDADEVTVTRHYPEVGSDQLLKFGPRTLEYTKADEIIAGHRVTPRRPAGEERG
ncbi:MAG: metallophosphoesterase [Actinobacteria bacterium]|nr:metallophosphoesterase [Actinomycetota bacterium]